MQLIEQHCAAFAHSWPFGVHMVPAVHSPLVQVPEQQSPSPAQGISFAAQLPAPHTPPVHTSEQQSAATVHAAPSAVHVGAPPAPLLVDELAPVDVPVPLLDVLPVASPPPAPPELVRSG